MVTCPKCGEMEYPYPECTCEVKKNNNNNSNEINTGLKQIGTQHFTVTNVQDFGVNVDKGNDRFQIEKLNEKFGSKIRLERKEIDELIELLQTAKKVL